MGLLDLLDLLGLAAKQVAQVETLLYKALRVLLLITVRHKVALHDGRRAYEYM